MHLHRHLLGAAVAVAVGALPAAAQDGAALYAKYCSQCHGETGAGDGPAAPHLLPKPRDFVAAQYKIRSTPNGALPTDQDLKDIIRRGMPYTSMPAWPSFTEPELNALVAHLKSFHGGFAGANPEVVPIPAAPAATPDAITKGAEVYTRLGCAGCHGEVGRGDGPSAPTLKDELGNPIRPADLTQPWTFRGGATREDVFRTLSTGLNGTPMPSFKDSLSDEERWQLTDWILSLAPQAPGYASLLVARATDDEVDLGKGAALFEGAPVARFPIVGQIMEPGRAFVPGAIAVQVQAVADTEKIAFLVRWNDMRSDTTGTNGPDVAVPKEEETIGAPAASDESGGDSVWGDAEAAEPAPAGDDVWGDAVAEEPAGGGDFWGDSGGDAPAEGGAEFSDAVAIQLPASLPGGIAKPYFIFGDGGNPVDLWFLDAARNRVRQYVGRGTDSVTPLEGAEVEGTASYDKGQWSAIFVRDLKSTTGVSFGEDQFVPIAFSTWDGTNRERGNRRGLTQWMYVYVPPRERPSPWASMGYAAVGVLGLELAVVVAMVRRRRRSEEAASEE